MISESTLTSEDNIFLITKSSDEKAIFQGGLQFTEAIDLDEKKSRFQHMKTAFSIFSRKLSENIVDKLSS